MPRKPQLFCANLFKNHKRRVTKFVRKVPQHLVKVVNNPLITEKTSLCLNCRKRLKKHPHDLSLMAVQGSARDVTESENVSSSEPESVPASHNTSLEEIVIEDEATEKVKDVLTALDQSPVRLSKCNKNLCQRILSIKTPFSETMNQKNPSFYTNSQVTRIPKIFLGLRVCFRTNLSFMCSYDLGTYIHTYIDYPFHHKYFICEQIWWSHSLNDGTVWHICAYGGDVQWRWNLLILLRNGFACKGIAIHLTQNSC